MRPVVSDGKAKRPCERPPTNPLIQPAKKAGANHGPKSEIQRLETPALVQLLIRAAADNCEKPGRKNQRLVGRAARELLIRLGHNRTEAKTLTEMIMEQMQ